MALIVSFVLCIALTAPVISAEDKVLTFQEQVHYIISKMMTPNLNSSCVADGCPEVVSKSLCPRIDDTATLVKIVELANLCMTKSMCGLVMDPQEIPRVTFSTDGVPLFGKAGVCSVVKGGALVNASHAQVTGVSREPQQVDVTLSMPDLTIEDHMECDGGRLNMSFYHWMAFNYTIVFTKNDVTVAAPKFKMISIAFHELTPQGKIDKTFTKFDPEKAARRGKLLGDHYGAYLNGFYQSVFEVASLNCIH